MTRPDAGRVPEPRDDGLHAWRRRSNRDTSGFRSPRVKALAARLDIDLDGVDGTGRGGRVTAPDVELAAAGTRSVPFNRVRSRSSAALLSSKRTAAHAWTAVECDYSAVEAVRVQQRDDWREREGFGLTYLPFVARAVVDACADYPRMNATVDGPDSLTVHGEIRLAIAVDLDHEGLVVPVIADADTLRIVGLARAIVDLAARARARRLSPDDVANGTFTITNPGAHRTYLSVPILNAPQVGILSTDGVAMRVRAGSTGPSGAPTEGLAIRPTGHLCLSYDARAIDYAYAGGFIGRVREILEHRNWRDEL